MGALQLGGQHTGPADPSIVGEHAIQPAGTEGVTKPIVVNLDVLLFPFPQVAMGLRQAAEGPDRPEVFDHCRCPPNRHRTPRYAPPWPADNRRAPALTGGAFLCPLMLGLP